MEFEHAWLTYEHGKANQYRKSYEYVTIYADRESWTEGRESQHILKNEEIPVISRAVEELKSAFKAATGEEVEVRLNMEGPNVQPDLEEPVKSGFFISLLKKERRTAESYRITGSEGGAVIEAPDPNGILYGAFELIRQLQLGSNLKELQIDKEPAMPLRMLNHWDNMDGSIERGYSGNSFFFKENEILMNERTVCYARLIASAGINAVVINNVNVKDAATWLITNHYFNKLQELSELLASYGIRLFLSLNYAAPVELMELDSADPFEEEVRIWWNNKMREVYEAVPGLGGFLIKADSEGRPGPFTYGRTHADGANMLAEAIEPYNGLIIWRCFVYNCRQDWRDRTTDRARSGYDHFIDLDGTFHDRVILQIKNGPMDFQPREPVHPLLGGLNKTNQILEVQIAQEYTGQQRHVCYLIPMFREILGFRTYIKESGDRVLDLVSGKGLNQTRCGMAAVCNTGNDPNWTGHDLAAANLYGFGRLAYEPQLTAEKIASEWIRLTYGNDPSVLEELLFILLNSWPAYESYTAPLGVGWMVNPSHHYGPSVDGYEYDRWGTYHRADHKGIGVDRSHNGTGYAMLYREPNASCYDDPAACPEELLLFFHHMPYTHRLKNGKTILQHIYDSHFEGVELVDEMVRRYERLKNKLPEKVYERTMERLLHQKEHSREWRDQINTYFYRKTGIPDEKGRKIHE